MVSRSGGKHFADAADHVALGLVEGEELEAVAQALAIAHDAAHFQGVGTEGQRNFEGDDFSGFEAAGESRADAILTEFGGASPASAEFAVLKHADLHAGVDGKARVAALVGAGRSGRLFRREFLARSRHKISGQWSVASGQSKKLGSTGHLPLITGHSLNFRLTGSRAPC